MALRPPPFLVGAVFSFSFLWLAHSTEKPSWYVSLGLDDLLEQRCFEVSILAQMSLIPTVSVVRDAWLQRGADFPDSRGADMTWTAVALCAQR